MTEYVSANGVRIAFDRRGDGDPVLLLGGTGMGRAAWFLSLAPPLVEAGYQVVAADSRGVGGSDSPPPPYSMTDLASDTAGLITGAVGGPCHVVGLSLGGFVAERLCQMSPDLVRTVTLIGCAGPTTAFARTRAEAERELFGSGPVHPAHDLIAALPLFLPPKTLQDDDATVEAWVGLLDGHSEGTEEGRLGQASAAWEWQLDTERADYWESMTVPALVVAFENDLEFPPSAARKAARAWPGAEFVEIPGVAHGDGVVTGAARISAELTAFLGRHGGTR